MRIHPVECKDRVVNIAGSAAINTFQRINAGTSEYYVHKVKEHKNSNTKIATKALPQVLEACR